MSAIETSQPVGAVGTAFEVVGGPARYMELAPEIERSAFVAGAFELQSFAVPSSVDVLGPQLVVALTVAFALLVARVVAAASELAFALIH